MPVTHDHDSPTGRDPLREKTRPLSEDLQYCGWNAAGPAFMSASRSGFAQHLGAAHSKARVPAAHLDDIAGDRQQAPSNRKRATRSKATASWRVKEILMALLSPIRLIAACFGVSTRVFLVVFAVISLACGALTLATWLT